MNSFFFFNYFISIKIKIETPLNKTWPVPVDPFEAPKRPKPLFLPPSLSVQQNTPKVSEERKDFHVKMADAAIKKNKKKIDKLEILCF